MNWRCDVYVYENEAGYWTTHVAARRRILPPLPAPGGLWGTLSRLGSYDAKSRTMTFSSPWRRVLYNLAIYPLCGWERLSMWTVRWIPLRPIGLPFDGATFDDHSPGACAVRLESLQDLGYSVPELAIRALKEEQAEIEADDSSAPPS